MTQGEIMNLHILFGDECILFAAHEEDWNVDPKTGRFDDLKIDGQKTKEKLKEREREREREAKREREGGRDYKS